MVMMMMMGGGEDNVVIDGDINHWLDGMEEAAGGPGPGSVTQLRVRCPGTEHTLAEEEEESGVQDPDPGPRIQDHLSDQQQGRTQEKKWPGSVTQLRVRLAEEEEESGIRMERDQTQARGCGRGPFV